MKYVYFFLLLILPACMFAQSQPVSIIPVPASLQQHSGEFILNNQTTIHFSPTSKELERAATYLQKSIRAIAGLNLSMNKTSIQKIELVLVNDTSIGVEGYHLMVSANTITIKANTKAGIVYGIQTLLQTLPAVQTNAKLVIPRMDITDYPRFKWRGMHLDVSRHFFGPNVIKQYIDLLAAYKFNTFHWHLVDDQGWRIEIKQYPALTNTGAWRVDHTNMVWGNRPQAKAGEVPSYGGYYTQDQIKEIIAYASERNITIVPEIEMPGHVASAIASYPFLSCTQEKQLPLTGGNYTNISSNYCAGNDSVFHFLENVLTEVIQLFPSTYIHIGGDEVDKSSWKKCTKCQQRIQTEKLKNEEELQSYFIKRIEQFIQTKKRKMIGWDEILEGGVSSWCYSNELAGRSRGYCSCKNEA